MFSTGFFLVDVFLHPIAAEKDLYHRAETHRQGAIDVFSLLFVDVQLIHL